MRKAVDCSDEDDEEFERNDFEQDDNFEDMPQA